MFWSNFKRLQKFPPFSYFKYMILCIITIHVVTVTSVSVTIIHVASRHTSAGSTDRKRFLTNTWPGAKESGDGISHSSVPKFSSVGSPFTPSPGHGGNREKKRHILDLDCRGDTVSVSQM